MCCVKVSSMCWWGLLGECVVSLVVSLGFVVVY